MTYSLTGHFMTFSNSIRTAGKHDESQRQLLLIQHVSFLNLDLWGHKRRIKADFCLRDKQWRKWRNTWVTFLLPSAPLKLDHLCLVRSSEGRTFFLKNITFECVRGSFFSLYHRKQYRLSQIPPELCSTCNFLFNPNLILHRFYKNNIYVD